ncbi:MAG: TMEM165/GDT1 family protein [Rhodocyclales bacterium]|nr:TMEM165/GDT1 family protein [Rhodocyclales bacterium]
MEAFLTATGLVALAEVGDKTQLLSLVLAGRYRAPWTICAAIFFATLANHAGAAALGAAVMQWLGPDVLRAVVAISFVALGLWMLVPDALDEDETKTRPATSLARVFAIVSSAFFLAEMGDKTQLATVALAAHYSPYAAVVTGTTVGMMLANAPVVWFGERLTRRLPARMLHVTAALAFVLLGIAAWWW